MTRLMCGFVLAIVKGIYHKLHIELKIIEMFLVSFSVLSISDNTISFVIYPIVLREKGGNASGMQAFTQQSPSCWWLLLEAWRQVELNALRFCKNDSNLRDMLLPLIKKKTVLFSGAVKRKSSSPCAVPNGMYLWVGMLFLWSSLVTHWGRISWVPHLRQSFWI